MKSTLIDYVGEKAIVKLEKAGHVEWLACRDFDDSKPEGTKWSSAQYFLSLKDAVQAALPPKTYWDVHIYGMCGAKFYSSHYVVEGRDRALEILPSLLCELGEEKEIATAVKKLKKASFTFFGDTKATNIEINPYELENKLNY